MDFLLKYQKDFMTIAISVGLYISSQDIKIMGYFLIGYGIYRFGNILEKFILKNLNLLIFLLIFLLFQDIDFVKNNVTLLSLLGGIIVFWYGYKKYERDKELELLEKYGNKFDKLKKNNHIRGIINLWVDEYYLYEKGYISDDLWEKINHKIEINISSIVRKNNKELSNYFGSDDVINEINGFGNFIETKLVAMKKDYEKYISGNIKEIKLTKKEIKLIESDIEKLNIIIPLVNKYRKINKKYFS